MHSFKIATEEDRDILVEMYYHEIEENQVQAQQFADDLIQRYNTILNISDSEICGTLSWEIRGGLDDGVIELVAMGVTEKYRRKGVGSGLVIQMLEMARLVFSESGSMLRIVYLFMENQNETARQFYESLGFDEEIRLSAFYPHDDAAIKILRVE